MTVIRCKKAESRRYDIIRPFSQSWLFLKMEIQLMAICTALGYERVIVMYACMLSRWFVQHDSLALVSL